MNLLTEYHPVRFGYHLRYLIESTLADFGDSSESDQQQYAGLLLSSIYEGEIAGLLESDNQRPYDLTPPAWAQYKTELFDAYDSYWSGGENIFHIQKDLLEMFARSSIDHVDLTSLTLPYTDFYLSFGGTRRFPAPRNSFFDGAYISYTDNHELFIYLTTINDITISAKIHKDELGFLLNDDHLYYLLHPDEEEPEDIADLIEESLRDFEIDHDFLGNEWTLHVKDMFSLIINCLCFLSSPHNDSALRFHSTTPNKFIKKYNKTNSIKARENALAKIKNQGFRRINYLGNSIHSLTSAKSRDKGNSTTSPHWRRGHWRNQAFGKSRQDHRLLWIMPTVVNKGEGIPSNKHIYRVK